VARAVLLYVLVLAQTCVDLRHLFARPLLHEGYPSVCSCAQACAVNLCDICTSLCAQYICVISVYLYARRERECLRVSVPVSAPVSQHLSRGVSGPTRAHACTSARLCASAPDCVLGCTVLHPSPRREAKASGIWCARVAIRGANAYEEQQRVGQGGGACNEEEPRQHAAHAEWRRRRGRVGCVMWMAVTFLPASHMLFPLGTLVAGLSRPSFPTPAPSYVAGPCPA